MKTNYIDGVRHKRLKVIPDERGRLMEILRVDDPLYQKFGQVYLTTAYPGVVKAWHYHRVQTDSIAVVHGMLKVVLYDARDNSPTRGIINEFFMGDWNQILLQIPPGVYHGFKCISEHEAFVVNTTTEAYQYENPDEYRVDPHEGEVPYDWRRRDG